MQGLEKFLSDNIRSKMQGATFIAGINSGNQTAGVLATLSKDLRKLSNPEVFWALSENELDLNINEKGKEKVVAILNHRPLEASLNPLIVAFFNVVTNVISQRNRNPTFLALDEAPTVKMKKIAGIVSTMRSFNISTVYMVQDLAQGIEQYGQSGFGAITSNLNTAFFCKTTEPKTAEYYEKFFQHAKSKTSQNQHLLSTKSSGSNTLSEKEVRKNRAHEFLNFKVGQVALISGGKSEILQIKKPDHPREELAGSDGAMESKLRYNYHHINAEIKQFAISIGVGR